MCASLRVKEARRRNESEGDPVSPRREPLEGASSTDLFRSREGLSESAPVGTRKMVNYA